MELPDREEMLRRLRAAWGDRMTGDSLFPFYTAHAGESLDGKGIVDMLVKANEEYCEDKPSFFRNVVTDLICLFSAALIGDNAEVKADADKRHAELGHR
jgi:hypothetical protein